MTEHTAEQVREKVDAVYRSESRRIFATLIRLLGDFELAEDALHDAFSAALEQWPKEGVPANPRTWLVSAGRFKAIDAMRRRSRLEASQAAIAEQFEAEARDAAMFEDESIEDDRLRLIFTCCHPALPPEARLALTLREVCGLTTEEIAHAFLTVPSTLAQRIVRAKAKIHDARIPYQVPSPPELPNRLDTVLRVIYLVFNEGYSASRGQSLTRSDLSGEAIRLGRLLVELFLAEMGKFNEELIKAGVLLAAEGLRASSKGARVKFAGEKRTVIDGPFTETKELVAGFWLWKCASLQEAIEWIKRCPNPMPGEEAEIEIRQVFEPEDFSPAFSPELREEVAEKFAREMRTPVEKRATHLTPQNQEKI